MNGVFDFSTEQPQGRIIERYGRNSSQRTHSFAPVQKGIRGNKNGQQHKQGPDIGQRHGPQSDTAPHAHTNGIAGRIASGIRSLHGDDLLFALGHTAGLPGMAASASAPGGDFHIHGMGIRMVHDPAMFDLLHGISLRICS